MFSEGTMNKNQCSCLYLEILFCFFLQANAPPHSHTNTHTRIMQHLAVQTISLVVFKVKFIASVFQGPTKLHHITQCSFSLIDPKPGFKVEWSQGSLSSFTGFSLLCSSGVIRFTCDFLSHS